LPRPGQETSRPVDQQRAKELRAPRQYQSYLTVSKFETPRLGDMQSKGKKYPRQKYPRQKYPRQKYFAQNKNTLLKTKILCSND